MRQTSRSYSHVSVRTDDKVYNCKTVAINFIYILTVSMIPRSPNVNIIMPQELILISATQRNPVLRPDNIPL
jgi:hypothetical protein